MASGLRGAQEPPVDVSAIAEELGIRVIRRPLPAGVWGVTTDCSLVAVNAALPEADFRFALAHELGHVLVRRGTLRWVVPTTEEWTCDWFAIHLLVPSEWLARELEQSDHDLANRLRVTPKAVSAQRLRLQVGGRHLRAAGRQACRTCGVRPHLAGCSCRRKATVTPGR